MRRLTVYVLGCLSAAPACAQSGYPLYDATLGTLPAGQPWLAYASNGIITGGSAGQSYVAGQGVRLTTDAVVAAGYSNYLPTGVLKNATFPVLDRTAGFRLDWTVQLHQETHASSDRAGFSTTLLSGDRRGIELGFWANEVWVQNGGFTHGESATWNTGQTTNYSLTIQDNSYQLLANGSTILTGSLRDYSSFGTPYNLSNFVFLGDNTSSASADVTLGHVMLFTPVPEPTGLLVGVAVLGGIVARYRNRRRVG